MDGAIRRDKHMEYCSFILNQNNECKNVFFDMNGVFYNKISKKGFLDSIKKLPSEFDKRYMDKVLFLYVSYGIDYLQEYASVYSDKISDEFNLILERVKTTMQKLDVNNIEKSYDTVLGLVYSISMLISNVLTGGKNETMGIINLKAIFDEIDTIKTVALKEKKPIRNVKIAKIGIVVKESAKCAVELAKGLLPLKTSQNTLYLQNEKKEMKPFSKCFDFSITEEIEYIKCVLIVSFSRMEELKEGLY